MKPTGIKITKTESRHFNSLARHIQPIAKSIESDMQVCQEANWEGMDRAYIEGKISDLQGNIRAMQRVLSDMLPELWEESEPEPPDDTPQPNNDLHGNPYR